MEYLRNKELFLGFLSLSKLLTAFDSRFLTEFLIEFIEGFFFPGGSLKLYYWNYSEVSSWIQFPEVFADLFQKFLPRFFRCFFRNFYPSASQKFETPPKCIESSFGTFFECFSGMAFQLFLPRFFA